MNKLKYIPGDLVTIETESLKPRVVKVSKIDENSVIYCEGWGEVCFYDEIKPIPITPKILNKNGFEHDTKYWSKTGMNDQKLHDYYKKKGLFSLVEDRNEYIIRFSPLVILVIKYVHELQHFLFGLGLNHEMEV